MRRRLPGDGAPAAAAPARVGPGGPRPPRTAATGSRSAGPEPYCSRRRHRAERHGRPGGTEADRDRMRLAALTLHDAARDKPDRKADVFADLGSPVSPLRLRPAATPSSSSSSAGSAKSPAPGNAAAGRGGRGSHSGELAPESTNLPRRPGHRRSGSGPLIFSGASSSAGSVGGGGGGGGSGSTASSPLTNALPTSNICPSGRRRRRALAPSCSDPAPATTAMAASCAAAAAGVAGERLPRGPALTRPRCSTAKTPRGPRRGALRRRPPAVICRKSLARGTSGTRRAAMPRRCGTTTVPWRSAPTASRAAATAPPRSSGSAAYQKRSASGLLTSIIDCALTTSGIISYSLNSGTDCIIEKMLGMIEKARTHFTLAGSVNQSDPAEWQKLHEVEIHQGRCMDARKIGDCKSALREADAAIAIGADSTRLVTLHYNFV
ncbi:unnamed protein product [Miscanthus lutarioriparius]|uniref:Uncharacterized protein n=1 Tax=Miscanthus lutarioriparius TaxID=422564 RepID=A0A811MG95_9POAL|nr:unnamed protein product [Miscanthus lutarioriparius]